MAFTGIKACVFDAYGTLFDLGDLAKHFAADLGDAAEPLALTWRRKQLEYTWLRTLMGRHADFWHVTGDALDHTLAALGMWDPALRAKLMEWWLRPRAYPEAAEVLQAVRAAGLRTAILSNGAPSMLTSGANASRLSPLLDALLSVETASVFKPHPAAYEIACDHFKLEPRQIAFVSGNGWDAAGAAAFGFRVVWVNRAVSMREALPAGPDAEIADLSGLPGVLGF